MFDSAWFLPFALLAILILACIRVVPESERYAVFALGRFAGFRGPGLVFKGKGPAVWRKVRTGERGTIISSSTVRLGIGDLPALIDGQPKVGAFVRVTGFETGRLLVAVDVDQRRVIKCTKCGHENEI
jgi:hypothetical protein